ncbi:MAG: sulfite exporter TauE/SafE family protein [Bryobacteraceae bacterium]
MPPQTAAVILILFAASLVRSAFGFGEALIAMPLLAGLLGVKLAAPLVAMVSSTISIAILVQDWRIARFNSVWRLAGASFAGIPCGMLFLKNVPEEPVKLLLAIGLIVYSAFSLCRFRLPVLRDERLAYGFGFVAGVLAGAYNTGGPPIVSMPPCGAGRASRFAPRCRAIF